MGLDILTQNGKQYVINPKTNRMVLLHGSIGKQVQLQYTETLKMRKVASRKKKGGEREQLKYTLIYTAPKGQTTRRNDTLFSFVDCYLSNLKKHMLSEDNVLIRDFVSIKSIKEQMIEGVLYTGHEDEDKKKVCTNAPSIVLRSGNKIVGIAGISFKYYNDEINYFYIENLAAMKNYGTFVLEAIERVVTLNLNTIAKYHNSINGPDRMMTQPGQDALKSYVSLFCGEVLTQEPPFKKGEYKLHEFYARHGYTSPNPRSPDASKPRENLTKLTDYNYYFKELTIANMETNPYLMMEDNKTFLSFLEC